MRTWPTLVLVVACGGAGATGSTRSAVTSRDGCPEDHVFCAVLVTNECEDDRTIVRCDHRPVAGLDEIELVPFHTGGEDPAGAIRVRGEDGVFAASPPSGTYRVRPPGQRYDGFTVTLDGARVVLDTRSASEAHARIVGHVRISVGGGAEGNTTVSDGGPGRFLVVSVLRYDGDETFDRTTPRFAVADRDGHFALAVPPGRYYVSDIYEVEDGEDPTFGPNMKMVMGRAVDVTAGGTAEIELTAIEHAP